jgi:imidazolonepropionase
MQAGVGPWGAIRDGALGLKNGRIAWIGPRADLAGPPETLARDVRDFTGQCLDGQGDPRGE